jgi:hypothetical protein
MKLSAPSGLVTSIVTSADDLGRARLNTGSAVVVMIWSVMPGALAFQVIGSPDFTTLEGFHSEFREVVFIVKTTGSAKTLLANSIWKLKTLNNRNNSSLTIAEGFSLKVKNFIKKQGKGLIKNSRFMLCDQKKFSTLNTVQTRIKDKGQRTKFKVKSYVVIGRREGAKQRSGKWEVRSEK